ncbi:uncharacterized protein LOC135833439 [Planococcus citri]|uniref:uncharacterized protein LOC135833439 n=1 Tax=Planococcus citri TaxID=170843 RepID=UPI0031F84FF9
MEKSCVSNVISNLFVHKINIFGEGSTYYGFESKICSKNENLKLQDGFNSTLLYGKILYKNKDGLISKSNPVMIKLTPKVALSKWTLSYFMNEMIFYTKILPVLTTREISLYPLFAKYHHGEIIFDVDQDHSALILEDLTARGYRMAEKKSFLDYQHLALMMRKLGQFHAHSYKARNTMPDLFHPLVSNYCHETNFVVNGELPGFLAKVCQRGLQHLKRDPDPVYSDFITKIDEMIQDSENISKRILTGGGNNPVSVIVHGDYLRNNVMFKYENNVVDDLVMVDMATCRYGSPVIDLLNVMYLHANQKMRNEHWNDLINEYYTALRETFPENRIPSKDEIFREFVDKSFNGYLIASCFLPHLIADDNDNTCCKNFDECLQTQNESFTDVVDDGASTVADRIAKLALVAGGNEADEALRDVLRDLIDRGFICK